MIAIQATCDNCSKVFDVKFKQKHHPKKIIETYFKCDHCKKLYYCFATDPGVRKLQNEIKTENNPFKRYAIQQEINERMNKLKERLT